MNKRLLFYLFLLVVCFSVMALWLGPRFATYKGIVLRKNIFGEDSPENNYTLYDASDGSFLISVYDGTECLGKVCKPKYLPWIYHYGYHPKESDFIKVRALFFERFETTVYITEKLTLLATAAEPIPLEWNITIHINQ